MANNLYKEKCRQVAQQKLNDFIDNLEKEIRQLAYCTLKGDILTYC